MEKNAEKKLKTQKDNKTINSKTSTTYETIMRCIATKLQGDN